MKNKRPRSKVVAERYGRVHYIAGCNECSWDAGIKTDATPEHEDVRNAVRKHVRETGHECWIESGTHTNYRLEKESEQ